MCNHSAFLKALGSSLQFNNVHTFNVTKSEVFDEIDCSEFFKGQWMK